MALPVRQIAHLHTTDFDSARKPDAKEFDKIVNVCTARAGEALKTSAAGYSQLQCNHIGDIIHSMSATHRTIRRVLNHDGPIDPETVDVLALVRLQLESLFSVCLMLEDPKYVTAYMQDYWRKKYVKYLLDKEETQNLARGQRHYQTGEPLSYVTNLGRVLGITPNQQMTVELEEIGTPLPTGVMRADIPSFPRPGRAIAKITSSPEKKRMLQRLYAKYVDLCSFAHGLGQANLLKLLFDNRLAHQKMVTDSQIKERWEQEVVSEAYLTSFFSIGQCTAELTILYPRDMGLVEVATRAWAELSTASLLTKAVWEIRTRSLLGAIG